MNIETANRLVELRKQKGLSQEELAERLGISRQAVSKWERAESSPDLDNIIELSRLYGVSIDELLRTDMEIPEPEPEPDEEPAGRGELTGVVNLVCRTTGHVELVGTDGDAHSVSVSGGERQKEDLKIYTEGDTLYIVSDEDRPRFSFFTIERALRITAALPRRMANIDVQLKGGSLRVNGLDMDSLRSKTGGGSVSAEKSAAGYLELITGGGSVTVRDVNAGSAVLMTGGGSVSASGLSAKEKITAKTGGGSVCVSCSAPEVEAKTGGGGIKLGCTAPCFVSAKTGGGGIDVVLNGCSGVDAQLVTGSGRTKLSYLGETVESSRKLSAKRGDGSTRVEAKSGGGGISVEMI